LDFLGGGEASDISGPLSGLIRIAEALDLGIGGSVVGCQLIV
jgi:hypothetical protein